MIIASEYRPAWWLPNAHLQTLYPSLLRPRHRPPVRRERLELPDGDFLDLDWTPEQAGPLVLVLHGLEGSIDSHYASGILQALHSHGLAAVLMHFRGCSGVPNRLLRSYHSGETGDIDHVVRTLIRRFPGRPLFALGYSLGGNALLKWLGEQGEAAPLRAAVAVSVPFDLAIAAQTMARGLSRIYQRHLLRKLHRSARAKLGYPGFPVTEQELARLTSFRSFDDRITAPIHGFRGVDHYYASASCRAFLHRIRVPTLILHARDDPFMTPAAIPQDRELSPQVQLELAEQGGHVGFVSGSPTSPEYYLEQRIPAFIHASA